MRLGLGVGIAAEMAVRDVLEENAKSDGKTGSKSDLVIQAAGHLFGKNVTRVAFKRGAYLRNFAYKFAELLSDRLDREHIAQAMAGHPDSA